MNITTDTWIPSTTFLIFTLGTSQSETVLAADSVILVLMRVTMSSLVVVRSDLVFLYGYDLVLGVIIKEILVGLQDNMYRIMIAFSCTYIGLMRAL